MTMSKFGKQLIESMRQAVAHSGGRKVSGLRVTTVKTPDVKAIRKALHMSQHRFALLYRIPLPTLKNWEQGRRAPDAPAAAYLRAIARRPKEVMEAVAG
jgi:putative transcriptional regulator